MRDTIAKVSTFKKNLFTPDEKMAIYEYLLLDENDRANYDKTQLPFKTNPRSSFRCSILRLSDFEYFKVTVDSLYGCNGGKTYNDFQVNEKIVLHGIGFLGPICGDTQYDVTLQIGRYVHGSCTFQSSIFKKQILARNYRSFHFLLDEPITIEPNAFDRSWKNYYWIRFSLKGANNVPKHKVDGLDETSLLNSGVKFNLRYFHNGKPITELLYKIQ